MTTNQQKNDELAHLEKAFQLLCISEYSVIDKVNERPDFLIKIDDEIIGIEVTDLYRDFGFGSSAKSQKDFPIICKEVISKYNKINGIPVLFFFFFDGNMHTNNRRKSIEKLCTFVHLHIHNYLPGGFSGKEAIDLEIPDSIKIDLPFLYSIMVRPTEKPEAIGTFGTFFDSTPPPHEIFEMAIRKKEGHIAKYKERCEKIWLLITLPSLTLSADYILQLNKGINIPHKFDAAYILDAHHDRVQVINK